MVKVEASALPQEDNNMYDVILFDLGGVLVELIGSPFPLNDQNNQFSLTDWFHSETAQKFERGTISADEFVQQVKMELDLEASTNEIVRTFVNWPRQLYPGTNALLEKLKHSYTLAILSNTNELHEDVLLNKFELNRHVNHIFLSHRMGIAKPDPAAFNYVLEELNVKAGKVLFVDDNTDNVNTAKALGIHAHQVQGLDQLRLLLETLNLI